MNILTIEFGSCGNIVQFSTTRELDLQKKILECESRLNSYKDVLVEEDTIFSNLERGFTCLDYAILESEKCLLVTHRQRQACEDEDDKYQVVHIVSQPHFGQVWGEAQHSQSCGLGVLGDS